MYIPMKNIYKGSLGTCEILTGCTHDDGYHSWQDGAFDSTKYVVYGMSSCTTALEIVYSTFTTLIFLATMPMIKICYLGPFVKASDIFPHRKRTRWSYVFELSIWDFRRKQDTVWTAKRQLLIWRLYDIR